MTPAPEVKIMRTPDGETVEVMKVGDKWVERVEGRQHANAPVVDGRRDITAQVNADAGIADAGTPPPPTPDEQYLDDTAAEPSSFMDDATDFLRGMSQGATFNRGEEASAELLAMTGGPDRVRAAGRGLHAPAMTPEQEEEAQFSDYLASERDDHAQSQERSPWLYRGGAVAGALPAAIGTAPAFGAGVNGLMLSGAASGALSASGEDVYAPAEERAEAADEGAAIGAGSSLLLGLGAKGLGGLADDLHKSGTRVRSTAPGISGGQRKALAKDEGFEFADEGLGAAIEEALPAPWFGFKPRDARAFQEQAGALKDESAAAIGQAVDEATARGGGAPARNVVGAMRESAARQAGEEAEEAGIRAAATGRQADRSAAMQAEDAWLTPKELQARKVALEGAGYPTTSLSSMSDSATASAAREGASAYRNALRDTMETTAPDLMPGWEAAKKNYAIADLVGDAAEGKILQEGGNQLLSLPSTIAITGGGALGMGLAGDSGALLGAGAPAAGIAAWELGKRYGKDAGASALHGMGNVSRLAGETLEAASSPAVTGRVAGELATGDEQQAPAFDDNESAVRAALEQSPAALGPYAQELQQAQQNGGVAYGAALHRLQKDPEFVRHMARLRQGDEAP